MSSSGVAAVWVLLASGALASGCRPRGASFQGPPIDGATANDGAAGEVNDAALAAATETCRAVVTAICERRHACTGESLDACLLSANLCPDYLFNADSNRSVADLAACVPSLRALTCTDIVLEIVPACLGGGRLPQNAGCSFSSQCARLEARSCSREGACGVCRSSGGVPLGGSCFDAECQAGSYCSRDAICTDNKVLAYAHEGERCDFTVVPPIGCVGDLHCLIDPRAVPPGGVCAVAKVGSLCGNGFSNTCGPGTHCSDPSGTNVGTCLSDAACGAATCDAHAWCDHGALDLDPVCVPLARLGEPCGSLFAKAPCEPPAWCHPSGVTNVPGTCVPPNPAGAACDATHPCSPFLTCGAGGTCEGTPMPTTCPDRDHGGL